MYPLYPFSRISTSQIIRRMNDNVVPKEGPDELDLTLIEEKELRNIKFNATHFYFRGDLDETHFYLRRFR